MADIQYTIGAKDNATPTLDKVGSTLSRLEDSTKNLGDNAETSFRRMAIGVDGLLKASGILFLVDKAIGSIGAAFSFVAGGVNDFNNAEAVANKLTEAMRANGEASQEMIDANIELSDVLEKRLNVEAESIQNLMSEAANLGVANDQLDNVTQAAIGLSEAMGVSLDDGLKKARLAADGNFAAFEKLIPSIKNMATDEEKLAAVMALSNKGLEQKESRAQSAAGAGERLATKIGDLAEVIGGALSPMIETATVAVEGIVNALVDILSPAMDSAGSAFTSFSEWVQEKMVAAANAIISGLTMAEVIFTNFGAVVGYVIDNILLAYESYRANTEHLFVTTLPAYITWFVDNFYNIIETGFNAVLTFVTNIGRNIADAFAAIWDFISSGGQTDVLSDLGEIAGRNLMDGFKSTVESLPQIAERAMTAREQELQNRIGTVGANLASQFNEKFAARAVKLGEGVGENLASNVELSLNKKIEEIEQETGVALKDTLNQSQLTKSSALAELSANESRLLTRGRVEKSDPMAQMASDIAAMKTAAEKTAEASALAASELEQIQINTANALLMVGIP